MKRQLIVFLIIGGIVFFIDTGFLQFFVFIGLGPYWGRLCSFSLALVSSWWLNRTYSFQMKKKPTLKEVTSYMVSISVGGLINWGIYVLVLAMWLPDTEFPAIAIIPATCVSMIYNFASMKFFIFKHSS